MTEEQRTRLWGREDELEFLERQLTRQSSFTLVYGDPQIGKSSLVRELKPYLREKKLSDYRVGFHKAVAAPHDPFLFALASLLDEIYTWEHTKDQFQLIINNLKGKLNADRFKATCDAVWSSLLAANPLKPVSKVLDWLKKEVESLDLSVSPPGLSAQDVERVLRTIAEACPDQRLVLIVDGYDLAYEMRGEDAAPAWEPASLLHLLDLSLHNVHVIVTWKSSPRTDSHFDNLRLLVQQHSGSVMRLGRLGDEAVTEWVITESPTLVSSIGKTRLVKLIDGLPKVAVELCAPGVGDLVAASQVAHQVKLGTYSFVHDFLNQCTEQSRDVLLQLAANGVVTPVPDLAKILAMDEAKVTHCLKVAAERNIVRELAHDTFVFEHDVKRQVVEDHIARFCLAKPYYERALVHSENCISQWFSAYSLSVIHAHSAYKAAHVLAQIASTEYGAVEDLYRQWLCIGLYRNDEEAVSWSTLATHPALDSRPLLLQFFVFYVILRTTADSRFGFSPEPSVALDARPAVDPEISRVARQVQIESPSALDQIHLHSRHAAFLLDTLALACGLIASQHEVDDYGLIVEKLRGLPIDTDLPQETVIAYAAAIQNLLILVDADLASGLMESIVSLASAFPGVPKIQNSYIRALVNVLHCGSATSDLLVACFANLDRSAQQPGLPAELAGICMAGFADLTLRLPALKEYGRIPDVLLAADTLWLAYPTDEQVLIWYAHALTNLAEHLKSVPKAELAPTVIDRLIAVSKAECMVDEFLGACIETATHLGEIALAAGDHSMMEQVVCMARDFASRGEITTKGHEALAICLANRIQMVLNNTRGSTVSLDGRERDVVRDLLSALSDEERREPNEQTASIYGTMVYNAIAADLLNAEWVRPLYEVSIDLIHRFPDSVDVTGAGAAGLSNATAASAIAQDPRWTDDIHLRLGQAVHDHPGDREIALSFGRSLGTAWLWASVTQGTDSAGRIEQRALDTGVDVVTQEFYRLRTGFLEHSLSLAGVSNSSTAASAPTRTRKSRKTRRRK